MSVSHVAIDPAGETLWLLPEKAVWWPARRMLLVADIHIGKAATYRVLGQPVPHGTTQDNLDRLDVLLDRFDPATLVFLGDFLHGPELLAATSSTLALLSQWRDRHSSLECILVRGNHDARAGDPSAELHIDVVDEPYRVGPFAFCHHPGTDATHYVLAGHHHPAYTLRGRGRDRLRLPCFLVGAHAMVLPAFGAFTGVAWGEQEGEFEVYVVGAGEVWRVQGGTGAD